MEAEELESAIDELILKSGLSASAVADMLSLMLARYENDAESEET